MALNLPYRSRYKLVFSRAAILAIAMVLVISNIPLSNAAEGDVTYDRTINLPGTACPVGVDFDSGDNMYVADWCESKVFKYDSNGVYVTEWGGVGSGPGQFDYPQDVMVGNDGRVYVTDYYNGRVQIFDTDGNYLDEFGSAGVGVGFLDDAGYITQGADNTFYVSEASGDRIERFDVNGNSLGEIGTPGFGVLQFNEPSGMNFGPDGNLYVTDVRNSRVQVLTPSGTFVREFGIPTGLAPGSFDDPYDVTFDDEGRMYIIDTNHDRVQIFDKAGAFVSMFGTTGTGNSQFDYAVGLTAHGDELFVTDGGNDRIQIFSIDDESPYVRAERVDVFSTGYGSEGWNGNGVTSISQAVPTRVQLPNGVTADKISMGEGFTAILGSDDKVYCYGQNVDGQFALGNNTNQTTPVEFTLPGGVTAVDVLAPAYSYNVFVLGSNGQVYGAGDNGAGLLGSASGSLTLNTRQQFILPGGVTALSMHMFSGFMAVRASDGNIYSAGSNSSGQLGDGTTTPRSTPVRFALPGGVTATDKIDISGTAMSVVGSDGNVYSAGENSSGELGVGSTTDVLTPAVFQLPGGVDGVEVMVNHGFFGTSVLGSDGQLYSAGTNLSGALGDGTFTSPRTTPVQFQLPGGLSVKSLTSKDGDNICVIASSDDVYCSGDNSDGQLGVGDYANRNTPQLFTIPGSPVITKVKKTPYSIHLLTDTGQVWGAGSNTYGELGTGAAGNEISPVQFQLPSGVTADDFVASIDPRTRVTILGSNGSVYSAGNDRAGKLGNGTEITYQSRVVRYLLPDRAVAESVHITDHPLNSLGVESTTVVARTPALNAFGTIVFHDTDGDNTQDPGEAGQNGLTISLYADSNLDGVPDGAALQTAQTATYSGMDGVVLYEALDEGGYVLGTSINSTMVYRAVELDSNEGGWFSDPSNLLIAPSSFPLGASVVLPPGTPATPSAPSTPGITTLSNTGQNLWLFLGFGAVLIILSLLTLPWLKRKELSR